MLWRDEQVNDEREVGGIIRNGLNIHMGFDLADVPGGDSFELTSPATGQRFRVTVTEVDTGEAVDAAIAAIGSER